MFRPDQAGLLALRSMLSAKLGLAAFPSRLTAYFNESYPKPEEAWRVVGGGWWAAGDGLWVMGGGWCKMLSRHSSHATHHPFEMSFGAITNACRIAESQPGVRRR